MSVRITPLRLDGFERLPDHARRCVFWEVDPAMLVNDSPLGDPEFEKEAWLSMVMLEWGCCGQVALASASRRAAFDTGAGPDDDDTNSECVGYAFYAPPRMVPRAKHFPTGPVSADAVLLTSMGVDLAPSLDGVAEELISRVVGELIRRGARALEAFGRTAECAEALATASPDPQLREALDALGECSVDSCVISAEFLEDVGFAVVKPHRYFPRLRLELDKGLGWKAEVEAALDRLLQAAELPETVGAAAAGPTGSRGAGDAGALHRRLVSQQFGEGE